MPSPDAESQSPTRNGLTQLFTKNKLKKKRDSAASSLLSSEAGSDGLNRVRDSLEGVIDKLKIHHDHDEDSGTKKLGIKTLGSKRRQKKHEEEEEQQRREEAARGRSVAERGTLENDEGNRIVRHDSGNSGSSLITYDDSEIET
jgi:hypothetical protein